MSTFSMANSQEALCTNTSSPLSEEVTPSVTEAASSSEEIDTPITPMSGDEQSTDHVLDLPPAQRIKDCYDIQWLIGEDAVIVTVDLEAHCHNQSYKDYQAGVRNSDRMVCEIGLAIIDSRELRSGTDDRYQDFWNKIHAYNIVPLGQEHRLAKGATRCRRSYCKVGDPNNFQYGYPRFVPKDDVKASFVKTIRSFVCEGSTNNKNSTYNNGRKIVWMFFAMQHDIQWLDEMGIDLGAEFPNSEFLDIQWSPVARKIKGRKSQCSASDLFYALGVPVTFAHNGGNDAVYELRAYLAELGLESKQWNELTDYRSLPMMEETIPPPPPRERKPKKASNNVDMPGVNVRRAPRRSTARVQQEVSQEQPLFADSRVFPSLGSRAPTLRREDQGMPADLARLVESAQLVDSANPQAGAKD